MVKETQQRASWVNVTVTGDPELASKLKAFLGLVLDWTILNEELFLRFKKAKLLKHYDQSTALKSTDRVQFYIMDNPRRERGEKAGLLFEEAKSKDAKDL